MQKDTWKPEQYNKFQQERNLPFLDLLNLIKKRKNMKIVDLGCGDGVITKKLHSTLKADSTLGVELSENMFSKAKSFTTKKLNFIHKNIEEFEFNEKYDLVFASASLQWVRNHTEVMKRASQALPYRGQFAFQLPGNTDYPTHTVGKQIEGNFAKKFSKDLTHPMSVHKIEEYSELLFRLGFKNQVVRMQVYAHILPRSEDVLEWVKGTFLTWYQKQLTQEEFSEFLATYESELFKIIPRNQENFYYPMKRILIWAEK